MRLLAFEAGTDETGTIYNSRNSMRLLANTTRWFELRKSTIVEIQ